MVKANSFNFAEIVDKYMKLEYKQSWEAILEATDEVAKESVKKLKQTSPIGKSGDYAKNWKKKNEKGRMKVICTVYGADPTYRLAHLLEKGHAKRGGGRTDGIEHIAPVEAWAMDEVVDRFISKMEKSTI